MRQTTVFGCLIVFLALLWTAEIAVIQEYTLNIRHTELLPWLGRHLLRWGLTISLILCLVAFLPKKLTALLMLLHVVFSLTLLTYYDYFGEALSEQVLITQGGEGVSFIDYILQIVNPWYLAALLAMLVLKLRLLRRLDKRQLASRVRKLWRGGLAAAAGALMGLSLFLLPPLHTVSTWGGWQFYAETYGYLPAWGISAWYNRSPETVLRDAVRETCAVSESRITDMDMPAVPKDARNIIIIQLESIDFALLQTAGPDGRPAMPFLQTLKDRSYFYEVEQTRSFGTATADFTMLTGMTPGGSRIPYKVAGFPFCDISSLPRQAAQKGFASGGFHGNYGYFYNRKQPFADCGFDALYFMPELVAQKLPQFNGYIPDSELFQFALKNMTGEKNVHFIITVTSHGPFDLTPAFPDMPYPRPDSEYERYINSARYVDDVLRDYIGALPPDSLVLIYGDHASWVHYPEKTMWTVPAFIHYTGANLAPQQQSARPGKDQPAVPFPELVHFVYKYMNDLPDAEIVAEQEPQEPDEDFPEEGLWIHPGTPPSNYRF